MTDKAIPEVEIALWEQGGATQNRDWQPYRCFDRRGELRPYFASLRCGEVEIDVRIETIDYDGVVKPNISALVETFVRDVTAFPVFVRASSDEQYRLSEAAIARRFPHHWFANGVSFRTTDEAMLAKLAM